MALGNKQPQVEDDDTAVPLLTLEGLPVGSERDLETAIFLGGRSEGSASYADDEPGPSKKYAKRTPLPMAQIVILCAVRLAEPISYTQIFPYINEMMEELKVTNKPSEIGYYSGVVDSIFAVCQMFTILQWGRLSDRIGRKPVIMLGLFGVALSSALFGLSKNLWWAVISRSMAGALSGNVAVVQSVIGEITDETNQASAFPLTGVSWSLGCIIGPMIGGNFVHPERTFPSTFGKIALFQQYPFLLPCLTSAGLTLCAIVFGAVFLKESLPSKIRLDPRMPSPITSRSEKVIPKPKEETSVRTLLKSPLLRAIFQNYFLLSILQTGFDVVFVLLSYTPVHLGGLSQRPEDIGYALAFSGIIGAILQVLVFPAMQRRFDNIPMYRALMWLWPIIYAMLPLLNILARWTAPPEIVAGTAVSEDGKNVYFKAGFLVWTGIGIVLALVRVEAMSFALNVILVTNAAPSKDALGSTFGLAQTVACLARSGGPVLVSTLFALSKDYKILDGNFVWVVMTGISILALFSTYQVRDGLVERSHKHWEEEMRTLS